MVNKNSTKIVAVLTAIIACVAVISQAMITTGSMANLFSYFTILSNSIIALSLTLGYLFSKTNIGNFFKKPTVISPIAVYIFIVALVYNTVLRGIVVLDDKGLLVDTLLHVVVPVLYVVYWYLAVPPKSLQYKNAVFWMVFPLAYLVYSLIRGNFVNWYPYPFLNVIQLGYQKVFVNIAFMITIFFAVALALIWINRRRKSI